MIESTPPPSATTAPEQSLHSMEAPSSVPVPVKNSDARRINLSKIKRLVRNQAAAAAPAAVQATPTPIPSAGTRPPNVIARINRELASTLDDPTTTLLANSIEAEPKITDKQLEVIVPQNEFSTETNMETENKEAQVLKTAMETDFDQEIADLGLIDVETNDYADIEGIDELDEFLEEVPVVVPLMTTTTTTATTPTTPTPIVTKIETIKTEETLVIPQRESVFTSLPEPELSIKKEIEALFGTSTSPSLPIETVAPQVTIAAQPPSQPLPQQLPPQQLVQETLKQQESQPFEKELPVKKPSPLPLKQPTPPLLPKKDSTLASQPPQPLVDATKPPIDASKRIIKLKSTKPVVAPTGTIPPATTPAVSSTPTPAPTVSAVETPSAPQLKPTPIPIPTRTQPPPSTIAPPPVSITPTPTPVPAPTHAPTLPQEKKEEIATLMETEGGIAEKRKRPATTTTTTVSSHKVSVDEEGLVDEEGTNRVIHSKELQNLFEQGTHSILSEVDKIRRAEGVYLLNEIAKRYGLRITVHDAEETHSSGRVEDEAEGRAIKQRKISSLKKEEK